MHPSHSKGDNANVKKKFLLSIAVNWKEIYTIQAQHKSLYQKCKLLLHRTCHHSWNNHLYEDNSPPRWVMESHLLKFHFGLVPMARCLL